MIILETHAEPLHKKMKRIFNSVRELHEKWQPFPFGNRQLAEQYQGIYDQYFIELDRWGQKALQKNLARRAAQIKFKLPTKINIEVTTQCVLKCEFCVLHSGALAKRRKKKFLAYPDFQIILDSIKDFTTHIEFTGGEPLLNRHIAKMIEKCNSAQIKTTVATNAQLLSTETRKKLLYSPPSVLLIAYETGHAETYLSHRKGGKFGKFHQRVKSLIKERNSRNQRYPLIQLQTVVSKKTLSHLDYFWEEAEKLGVDKACTKPIFIWPDGSSDYIGLMKREYIIPNHPLTYHRMNHDGELLKTGVDDFCPNLQTLHIGTSGEAIPCWYNLLSSPSMGNILDTHFYAIWFSSRFESFRKKMSDHSAYTHNCCHCIGIYNPDLFQVRSFSY